MNDIHNTLQTKAFYMKTKKFFLLRTLVLTKHANNTTVLVVGTFATLIVYCLFGMCSVSIFKVSYYFI